MCDDSDMRLGEGHRSKELKQEDDEWERAREGEKNFFKSEKKEKKPVRK